MCARDYKADVEAIVAAKLPTWKLEHFGLFADIVKPAPPPEHVASTSELMDLEDQAQAAKFRELRAKIAGDAAEMTAWNAKCGESERRKHVVLIMHERGQQQIGKQLLAVGLSRFLVLLRLCETFMEKTCRVSLTTEKSPVDPFLESALKSLALRKKAGARWCCLKWLRIGWAG